MTIDNALRGLAFLADNNINWVLTTYYHLDFADFARLFTGHEVGVQTANGGTHYSIVLDGVQYVAFKQDEGAPPLRTEVL